MKYVFEEVAYPARKTVKCAAGCGRRLTRSRKFSQTVNPWNVTADGRMKTAREIYAEVREEGRAWEATPETCAHCTEPTP